MTVIENPQQILKRINLHIRNFGHLPDHNARFLTQYYFYPGSRVFYFDFGQRGGILACKDKNTAQVISEPLSRDDDKLSLFLSVVQYIFGVQRAKKILLEDCREHFKKELAKRLSELSLGMQRSDVLVWPVLYLKDFDADLRGSRWKRLRYIRNVFAKIPKVRIIDAAHADANELRELIHGWRKGRKLKERVYYHQYLYAVDDAFSGCDICKAVYIGKKPIALVAGWRIPNTQGYYSFLDIHDYRYEGAGEFANLQILLELKKRGFDYIDFGGSDKKSIIFKDKFQPTHTYKTYDFYITQK